MDQPPYTLDGESRAMVLQALAEVCSCRGWSLFAAQVRTNHVHAIVEAEVPPEKVMNDFKAYASRALNRREGAQPGRRRWARHGSTRWLWKDQDVRAATTCPEASRPARSESVKKSPRHQSGVAESLGLPSLDPRAGMATGERKILCTLSKKHFFFEMFGVIMFSCPSKPPKRSC